MKNTNWQRNETVVHTVVYERDGVKKWASVRAHDCDEAQHLFESEMAEDGIDVFTVLDVFVTSDM